MFCYVHQRIISQHRRKERRCRAGLATLRKDKLSFEMRWARILLPSLAGCVYRRLLQFKILSPTAPHPFLKMGKYFFMVCCCSLLSQMPWDHRPLGTSSWVQVWWMLWSSKFSDLWVERWRGKLEKGKEKRNTLVWLAVCLKRGSCVLSKVRYLKTGLLCKQLASSWGRKSLGWINALLHPPSGRMRGLELWRASWHLRAFAPAVPSV